MSHLNARQTTVVAAIAVFAVAGALFATRAEFADFAAHKPKPTNAVAGVRYMLAGATQRSDSDPRDHTTMQSADFNRKGH